MAGIVYGSCKRADFNFFQNIVLIYIYVSEGSPCLFPTCSLYMITNKISQRQTCVIRHLAAGDTRAEV